MVGERQTRRAFVRATGLAVAGVALAGCSAGGSQSKTVTMTADSKFDPERVTVDVGGTVEWVNDDGDGHTVTAYADAIPAGATYFASGGFEDEQTARNRMTEGLVDPGERYSHTFEVAGRYEYYCIPHEGSGMVGTVRVQ